MKVHELIAELEKLPQNHTVVVDRYSDYTDNVAVDLIKVVPQQNGTWYRQPFGDEINAHGAVYIGGRG